jgi:nucleotide-binding universal stress UspA family protein
VSEKIGTIVCATDLGTGSEEVLDFAIRLTEQLRAKLHIVTVIEDEREKAAVEPEGNVPQDLLDKYHADHAGRVREAIEQKIAARRAEYQRSVIYDALSHIRVRAGDDAAQLILDEAQSVKADLILLGTSGTSALKGLLFGSVSQAVIAKVTIPVLLVPIAA